MLVKILTIAATVVILMVVFLPFLLAQVRDTANRPEPAFYCVRCNRGYNEITFAWHQQAMHPGPSPEMIDRVCAVGAAQLRVVAPALELELEPPAPEPLTLPEVEPIAAAPERGIVEVTSGGQVYRLYAGGRK